MVALGVAVYCFLPQAATTSQPTHDPTTTAVKSPLDHTTTATMKLTTAIATLSLIALASSNPINSPALGNGTVNVVRRDTKTPPSSSWTSPRTSASASALCLSST